MKVVTVVGARPQFIKAAALSRVLRKEHQEILVHTGQHYDYNMSDIFFEEMNIPKPDYNLGIACKSHAEMTGKMMIELEKVLLKEQPDVLIVFGDTNSTLAAALAAVKIHIPIIHIEAGNRVGALDNPEEVNRILTDHISTVKFVCVQSAMNFIKQENLEKNSYLVGDLMYDSFLYYKSLAQKKKICILKNILGQTCDIPQKFIYMTCHRQENTQNGDTLFEILNALQEQNVPTIYPVHPRNKKTVLELMEKNKFDKILFVEPLGYLESIHMICNAEKIVTDSGGVQREAFFAQKQCVTILDFVCWPETMINNCNQLAKPQKEDIVKKLTMSVEYNKEYYPFGRGDSAEKICDIIREIF